MRKAILTLLPALIALSGCGHGGGSGTSNSRETAAAISAYMSKEYSREQTSFRANLQALENNEAANDQECTQHHLAVVANLKKAQVQTFLNAVIAFIQAENSKNQIDKAAVAPLFATYQTEDAGWIASASMTPACGFTAEMISATGYPVAIASYYATTLGQVNAM